MNQFSGLSQSKTKIETSIPFKCQMQTECNLAKREKHTDIEAALFTLYRFHRKKNWFVFWTDSLQNKHCLA